MYLMLRHVVMYIYTSDMLKKSQIMCQKDEIIVAGCTYAIGHFANERN